MQEISRIERKGVVYDIKDRFARELVVNKYSKPSDGIPASDLSEDLRETIEKVTDAIPYLPDKTSKLVYGQGNPFRFIIPLVIRTITIDDGVLSTADADFIPSDSYPISLVLDNGESQIKLIISHNRNNAVVQDSGSIPVGVYSMAVVCKDSEGNQYRFKESQRLYIVTDDIKHIPGEIRYLDAAVFFASGNADRGIAEIMTEEDSTSTTVTFLLTDGDTVSFSVTKGIEAIVDQDWDITSERAIANKVVTGFHDYVMGKESFVSGETLNIEW